MRQRDHESELAELLDRLGDDVDDRMVALVKEIGVDAANKVLDELGGGKVYIPKKTSFWKKVQRLARNKSIQSDHAVMPTDKLQEKYKLSKRSITRITKKDKAA